MASELKNIYLICGDEQYLREKKKKELLHALHTEGSMSFNAFEGKETDRAELARLSVTMPFLSEKRTILLSDTGYFKGSAPQEVVEILQELPESTVIIFYETEADAGNALYKLVKERGEVCRYQKAEKKPYKEAAQEQGKIRTWVQNELKKQHRSISGRALTKLLQLCGYDMLNLHSELEKLISYTAVPEEFQDVQAERRAAGLPAQLPGETEIREADIDAICTRTVSDRVFDMLSAKLSGNTGTALSLFEDLLALKTPPLRVLYLLSKQFIQVYQIKEASRERIGDAALAERIGIRDWQLRKLREQSMRISAQEARRYAERCAETETKIKLGDLPERLGVEMILAE